MEWHERLKILRKELGFSRKKMARLFGVSPDHYRKYERGERMTGLLEMHVWTLEYLNKKKILEKFAKEVEKNRN